MRYGVEPHEAEAARLEPPGRGAEQLGVQPREPQPSDERAGGASGRGQRGSRAHFRFEGWRCQTSCQTGRSPSKQVAKQVAKQVGPNGSVLRGPPPDQRRSRVSTWSICGAAPLKTARAVVIRSDSKTLCAADLSRVTSPARQTRFANAQPSRTSSGRLLTRLCRSEPPVRRVRRSPTRSARAGRRFRSGVAGGPGRIPAPRRRRGR